MDLDAFGDILGVVGTADEVGVGTADEVGVTKVCGGGMCGGRKRRQTWLHVISMIISTADLITDWWNCVDFSLSNVRASSGLVLGLWFIVLMSTVLYVCDVLLLVAKWKAPTSVGTRCLGACVTFGQLAFEDVLSLLLCILVHREDADHRYCPLVLQYRTIPGLLALIATGISAAWRAYVMCWVYLARDLKAEWGKEKIYLLMGTLFFTLMGLGLTGWCFASVFKPKPSLTQPIYVTQQIDAHFYLHRAYNSKSGQVLHPDAEDMLTDPTLTLRNVSCDGLTRKLTFGNVADLQATGEVSKQMACEEASPFYEHFLQPAHAQMLNETVSCTMAFIMKYSQENWELLYYMGYQLLQLDGSCINGTLRNQTVMIPAAEVWRHQALSDAIWRKECDNSSCPRREGVWSDNSTYEAHPNLPYYSCKSNGCGAVGRESQIEPLPAWLLERNASVHVPVFQIRKEDYPCYVVSRFEPLLALNVSCNAQPMETENGTGESGPTPGGGSDFSYCNEPLTVVT